MARGLQILTPRLVNPAEIEMGKRVRFVSWGEQRALKPTHAGVRITFGQEITANVVVGISESFVDPNSFQTFFDGFVVSILKTVNPAQEGMCFRRRINFD